MIDPRLRRLEDVRALRRDQRRREFAIAWREYARAHRFLNALVSRRKELVEEITTASGAEMAAMMGSAVDISQLNAVHAGHQRRINGLAEMDVDIGRATQMRAQKAKRAEECRIAYAQSQRLLDRWHGLVERMSEQDRQEGELREELAQDLTVKDRFTGKWVARIT